MFAACGYLHAIRYIKGTKPFVPTSLGCHEKLRFARLLRRSYARRNKNFYHKKTISRIPMKKLSIIIPCYNELKTIEKILGRINAVVFPEWEKEIIVIDDHSVDGTKRYTEKYEDRVTVVYQPENGGKGTAVNAALKRRREIMLYPRRRP